MEVIKGRMYDYNNGRFLSVDPFIQNPTSTQSMNPYTYIFNNPLSGVDPSGYISEGACGPNDLACQWDQSMASVLGVSRDAITEMYNGIREQQQNSKSDKSDNSEKESQNGGGTWSRFTRWLGSDAPGPTPRLKRALPETVDGMIKSIEDEYKAGRISGARRDLEVYKVKQWAGSIHSLPSTKGDAIMLGVDAALGALGIKGYRGLKEQVEEYAKEISLSLKKYGEAAEHIVDAQKAGKPSVLTIARDGASTNRKASIGGIPKVKNKQLDEYPPAMFQEGGAGASVRPINPSNNMGAGACIGNACRGLSNGEKVKITVVD